MNVWVRRYSRIYGVEKQIERETSGKKIPEREGRVEKDGSFTEHL